jgi:hypothetical protein
MHVTRGGSTDYLSDIYSFRGRGVHALGRLLVRASAMRLKQFNDFINFQKVLSISFLYIKTF